MFLPKSKQSTTFAYDWDGVDWIYYPLSLFGPAFRVDDRGRAVIDRWLGWAAAIGATVMLCAVFGLPAIEKAHHQLWAAYSLLALVMVLFVWAYRRLYRAIAWSPTRCRPRARLGAAAGNVAALESYLTSDSQPAGTGARC